MTTDCAAFRILLAELALDVAPAQERASAFAHAEECAACSALLTQATSTADLLLLVVPPQAPPAGARRRTLDLIQSDTEPGHFRGIDRRRLRRRAVTAAAVAVIVTGGAAAGIAAYHPDHRNLRSFTTALDDRAGRPVGRAVLTGGSLPSLFLSFTADSGPVSRFQVLAVDQRGATVTVGTAYAAAGVCTFSHVLPVDISRVRTVELQDATRRPVYSASFTASG